METEEEIVILDAKSDGERVMAICLANIKNGNHPFLYESLTNQGRSCQDEMKTFQEALPLTTRLLADAIRQSREQEALS